MNVLGPLSVTCRERARAELGERGFATAATAGAAVAARELVAEVRAELLAARTSPRPVGPPSRGEVQHR